MHMRQQIRAAFAALLAADVNITAAIYTSRTVVLQDAEIPGLIITTDSEQSEFGSIGFPVVMNRRLRLTVRAVAKVTANLDNTLDSMIEKVEVAVYASAAANTLGGLVKSMELSSLEIDMMAEGDLPVGQAIMTFEVNYKTLSNAPGIAI